MARSEWVKVDYIGLEWALVGQGGSGQVDEVGLGN